MLALQANTSHFVGRCREELFVPKYTPGVWAGPGGGLRGCARTLGRLVLSGSGYGATTHPCVSSWDSAMGQTRLEDVSHLTERDGSLLPEGRESPVRIIGFPGLG